MSDIEYGWPEGVPETYEDLYREYGNFVAKRVERYNKVDRNFEDLLQDIWLKLINSDVLHKYAEKAAKTLPPTLTAREACAYWGISFEAFVAAQQRYHEQGSSRKRRKRPAWMPEPMNGESPLSDRAVYYQVDVLDLAEVLDQPANNVAQRTLPQVMPFVGAQGFRAYLTMAIHNHFANWCRTRSRKYKDLLLPKTAVVVASGTESFRHIGNNEEGSSWEMALVSPTLDAEVLTQCSEFLGDEIAPIAARAGLDMSKVDEWEEYRDAEGLKRMRPTLEARQALEVLEYVAQGYTIREAVKTQQRAEVRRVRLLSRQA